MHTALTIYFSLASTSIQTQAADVYIGDAAAMGLAVTNGSGPRADTVGTLTYILHTGSPSIYTAPSNQLLTLTEVNFFADASGTLTPFVARFLGGSTQTASNYEILSKGDPLTVTSSDNALGASAGDHLENRAFTVGAENPTISVNAGDQIVAGWLQSGNIVYIGAGTQGVADYISNGDAISGAAVGAPPTLNSTWAFDRPMQFNIGFNLGPDTAPPAISTLNPADDAIDVAAGSNLQITFNESVFAGNGNIVIKNLTAATNTTIAITDASQVSFSGSVVTINPTNNLADFSNYAVQIGAGAVEDTANNGFPGIGVDTTWNFTTAVPDLTPPTIFSLSPADDATGIALDSDLTITFDEAVQKSVGNIALKRTGGGAIVETIDINSTAVTVSGAQVTIDPASDLDPSTGYYVEIDSTAIEDLSGNSFPGITGNSDWNFATLIPPPAPLLNIGGIWFIGDSITQSNADGDGNGSPRKSLYDLLIADGAGFSYTGHFTANLDGLPNTNEFHYHSGISGSMIGAHTSGGRTNMTAGIPTWWNQGQLASVKPSAVLIMLGTNDIDQNDNVADAPNRIRILVNTILAQVDPGAPNPAIFVAQIPPNTGSAPEAQRVVDFNNALPAMVSTLQGEGKDVILVDQWSRINANTGTLMRDSLHTNTAGNNVLGEQWYKALHLRFAPSGFPAWQITHFGSTSAPEAAPDQNPDGDTRNNLYEFTFGTDPNSPDEIRPTNFDGTVFTATRRKTAGSGISYRLEESSTLHAGSWTEVPDTVVNVISSSGHFETVEITKSTGGWLAPPHRYLRLAVTPAP